MQTAAGYTMTKAITPAPPDPFLAALAHDKNLALTDSRGCSPSKDLTSGQLDLRVTSLLAAMADRWQIRVSCLHTGHSKYVAGTRSVSNHTLWRAVDIDVVNHRPVNARNQDAKAAALWLSRLTGPLRPTEIGTPWHLAGPGYFTDHSHQNHLHIGYDQRLGEL
jgi:hypothetical protein